MDHKIGRVSVSLSLSAMSIVATALRSECAMKIALARCMTIRAWSKKQWVRNVLFCKREYGDTMSPYSLRQKNSDSKTGVPLDSLLGIEFSSEFNTANSTIWSVPSIQSKSDWWSARCVHIITRSPFPRRFAPSNLSVLNNTRFDSMTFAILSSELGPPKETRRGPRHPEIEIIAKRGGGHQRIITVLSVQRSIDQIKTYLFHSVECVDPTTTWWIRSEYVILLNFLGLCRLSLDSLIVIDYPLPLL